MIELNDFNNPSFALFPVNNNRTAYRPVSLPMILVVPFSKFTNGNLVSVRIYIEDVPQTRPISGHDHITSSGAQALYPNRELFSISISASELAQNVIDVDNATFIDATGQEVDKSSGEKQDNILEYKFINFKYTTTSGLDESLPYIPDAYYYDLSDKLIETDILAIGHYNLVYEVTYYKRSMADSPYRELVCIDTQKVAVSKKRFEINHPGEVLSEMVKMTPEALLNGASRATDDTIAFYRPFSDLLQDVYDEYEFISKLSSPYEIPKEFIPYLAQLLGWDLPYFPRSKDSLRRAALLKTSDFQSLKGSVTALKEIFRLFGFKILISKIWSSTDGKRLIQPGEKLEKAYSDQEITFSNTIRTEALLHNHSTNGFAPYNIPLIYRPQSLYGDKYQIRMIDDVGPLTIRAVLVEKDSDAYNLLAGYKENDVASDIPYEVTAVIEDEKLVQVRSEDGIVGYSSIQFDELGNAIQLPTLNSQVNEYPIVGLLGDGDYGNPGSGDIISSNNISYDPVNNTIDFRLNSYIEYDNKFSLFVYATYQRQELVIPEAIKDLVTNRFAIKILKPDGSGVQSDVIDFMLDFIYKIKAFHTILYTLQYPYTVTDTYLVNDLCLGGLLSQRFNTDLGKYQVPPAIIPKIPTDSDCIEFSATELGYKKSDIEYRLDLLSNSISELLSWVKLDGRVPGEAPKIEPNRPIDNTFQYTAYGQDRVYNETPETIQTGENSPGSNANQLDDGKPVAGDTLSANESANKDLTISKSFRVETDTKKPTVRELDGTDYCYKGRVSDHILYNIATESSEIVRLSSCRYTQGNGVYWTLPSPSIRTFDGISHKNQNKVSSELSLYSGDADNVGQYTVSNINHKRYLSAGSKSLDGSQDTFLGKLLRSYGLPKVQSLHYSNRRYYDLTDDAAEIAIQRPSLDIQTPYQHFPGCTFPTQNKLENDYTHAFWRAKPWDHDDCGIICTGAEYLNPILIDGTLVFDDEPYFVAGNGLKPDITSFGEHILDGTITVHQVYTTAPSGHESIVEDDVVTYGTGDTINSDFAIFDSASECGTGYIDYVDGYPSLTNEFEYDPADCDLYRDDTLVELFDQMEVPSFDSTSYTLAFQSRSGILSGTGIRNDCGCSKVGCGTESEDSIQCLVDHFVNQDGYYEPENDQIWVYQSIKIEETIGASSYKFDGSIRNSLMLNS